MSSDRQTARAIQSGPRRAKRLLLVVLAVASLGLVALIASLLILQRIGWLGPQHRYHDPVTPAISQRRDAIEAELTQLGDHPWAGEYFHGGALGPSLSLYLAPDGGVVTVTGGDLGVFGANAGGVVQARNGRLDFTFDDPEERFLIPENAYPVRWGARRYLVPEERLIAFVSAVNHGEEPRDHFIGRFLLAVGDEDEPIDGVPSLPDGYARFLRTEPMEVGIVSVESERVFNGSYCRWQHVLELDRGLDDGLEPGLVLMALPPARQFRYVTVQSSTASSATGVITGWCPISPGEQPETTWRLTTGAMGEVVEWTPDNQDCPAEPLD